MNKQQQTPEETMWVFARYIALGFLFLFLLFSTVYTIQAGQRGVLLTFGKPSLEAIDEGLHFKFPLIQKKIKVDVQTQKYESAASAASKDLQVVSTNIAVNFHLTPEEVPILYRDIGLGYRDRIIQPAVQEVVKATTAQFTAEELITRRPEVKEAIELNLRERLLPRGMVVEEISITDFDFSQSFNAAIEAKVTAEQEALKAERELVRIEIEAQQKVVAAKAEAESIRIQSQALQDNPDILQLRAIEKWDGIMPKVIGGATPFIDISTI